MKYFEIKLGKNLDRLNRMQILKSLKDSRYVKYEEVWPMP